MARTRDDDYDDEQGFARLDDAGSDDDEDGARRAPAVEAPAGAEVAELRAQVATLTGQVERLRAGATLEARRSEPATVGDVVDAVHAVLPAARRSSPRSPSSSGQRSPTRSPPASRSGCSASSSSSATVATTTTAAAARRRGAAAARARTTGRSWC